ncbi:MAG: glycosyltransferase family 4 protein [Prevotella sp.]|nr:glycosyltransferase family 4 protein [Prevotella sp.]
MHIVYVCREYPPSLRGGGIASYIKEMAQGLCEVGHRVTVICASDDTRKETIQDDNGVTVIRLKGGDFIIPEVEKTTILKKFRGLYRFHSYRKRIVQAIMDLKNVDIIEVPEYGAEGFYLNKLSIPVVTRLHTPMLLNHSLFEKQKFNRSNWYYYWQGIQELKLIKQAQYLSSCSTSLKEWASQYIGINDKWCKVIYNPIQIKEWSRYKWTPQNHKTKKILFAGTICDWKGCGDLAEACKLLHEENPQLSFQLDLVGKTGRFADELKQAYGTYEWFNLIGKVTRVELMRMYTTADVICFPSWWENMPMVCIEAMLCGGIVLGSNSGGMSEIIINGKNGFLLPPQQPEMWSEKIKEILAKDEEQLSLISSNAHNKIKTQFCTQVIVSNTITFYKQIINNK